MGSLNKVILIGHLGRDAEVKFTQSGTAVATFNLATTETWKDREGKRNEKTEWHRVVVWGKAAEALGEYLVKGKQVAVEGKLTTRQWDDKDGNKRYTTEIRSDQITLLGGGGGGKRRDDDEGDDDVQATPRQTTRTTSANVPDEDDIPF